MARLEEQQAHGAKAMARLEEQQAQMAKQLELLVQKLGTGSEVTAAALQPTASAVSPERPPQAPPSTDGTVVLMRGWIHKRGLVNTAFKRRWLVLTSDRVLTWYPDTSSTTPRGSMAIGVGTRMISDGLTPSSSQRFPFVVDMSMVAEPSPSSRRQSIGTSTQSRLECEAENEAEKAAWAASLLACSVLR